MTKALKYVLTALLAGIALTLGAPAASAHGGAIKLEVTGDGDHNVNVVATWKKDGHPVTETVIATLTATSADGRTFGPVPLMSAPEGQSLYHSAEPLPSGEWKVTVKATEPAKASKTVTVKAGVVDTPPEAAATTLAPEKAAATGPLATRANAQDADDSAGMPLKIGIIVLVVAAAGAALVFVARRRNLYARR
ncbi:hypothetical protein [Microbispora sp. H11081]|uniref:hypothetical protein n=1 Tax=Microbispora sp. H11081 TaxID=2729107 RepID=UPI001473D001|nr:hypothetical protein [Microbispora sp. H11081]